MGESFWFWLALLLILFLVAAWPAWPYTRKHWPYKRGRGWSYGPSAVAAVFLGILMFFFWIGAIAVWGPWATY